MPADNKKTLIVPTKDFIDSVERVTTVSMDRKEGVKLIINKDNVNLSVNSTNSGDGNEVIKGNFNDKDLTISFNSKYLLDIANVIEDNKLKMNFNNFSSFNRGLHR